MANSLTEEVLSKASPQEALLYLCKVVEGLEAQIDDLSTSDSTDHAWGEWDAEPQDDSVWTPPDGVAEKIEELKCELQGNESDEESKALRAQIFLLEDELKPPPDHVDLEQQRTHSLETNGGDVVVDLPVVSLEEEDTREQFAREVLKLTEVYGEEEGEEYIKSYRKGGPLLLYYSDRDYVNGLPANIKQALVNDVEELSPMEAGEMGRDILKDLEAGGPDISVQNILNTMS